MPQWPLFPHREKTKGVKEPFIVYFSQNRAEHFFPTNRSIWVPKRQNFMLIPNLKITQKKTATNYSQKSGFLNTFLLVLFLNFFFGICVKFCVFWYPCFLKQKSFLFYFVENIQYSSSLPLWFFFVGRRNIFSILPHFFHCPFLGALLQGFVVFGSTCQAKTTNPYLQMGTQNWTAKRPPPPMRHNHRVPTIDLLYCCARICQ